MENSMPAANVKTLSLRRSAPHFAKATATATTGPVIRFQIGVGAASGRCGGSSYGHATGAGGGVGSSVPTPSISRVCVRTVGDGRRGLRLGLRARLRDGRAFSGMLQLLENSTHLTTLRELPPERLHDPTEPVGAETFDGLVHRRPGRAHRQVERPPVRRMPVVALVHTPVRR